MAALSEIGRYLVETIATLYLILVVLRGILQASGADFYNPISQFIARATNPPVLLLRRVIPVRKRFDPAVVLLAIGTQLLAIVAVLLFADFTLPNPLTLLAWSVVGLAALILQLYFIALIAMIVLSWVAQGSHHPAIFLLHQITEPVMAPFRSLLPNMGGIDFSPILLFVLINIIQIALRHMAASIGLPAGLVIGL